MERGSGLLRLALDYFTASGLVGRAVMLAVLTLILRIPLGMVDGVVADRQSYENDAINNVRNSWGRSQTFVGPMIVLPYRPGDVHGSRLLTLLPEKLTIDGKLVPEQRRRGLFTVTVYSATFDVVAEFNPKAEQSIDWTQARLSLGLSDIKSIEAAPVEVDGQKVEWIPDASGSLVSLQAPLGAAALANRDSFTVHFRVVFSGSGSLCIVPIGRRTDATIVSSWPSPSFTGRYLPTNRTIDQDGFRANWSVSYLGRGYGQVWDTPRSTRPADDKVRESAFAVTLLNTVDPYRETDRAIKYGVLFIALTFATCLMFEFVGGTRPSIAQYGLIGLSLCVFYLLLLSLSEQVGFGAAYLVSGAAVVAQATVYNWALQRRRLPAAAFGVLLAGLYGGLYGLLQLEDVALLTGSLLLFAVLSLAMWFTRNLHRRASA
jgi:inner membrane protein